MRYKALSDGFLGKGIGLIKAGEIFEFTGTPGKWMHPLDAPKPAPIVELDDVVPDGLPSLTEADFKAYEQSRRGRPKK